MLTVSLDPLKYTSFFGTSFRENKFWDMDTKQLVSVSKMVSNRSYRAHWLGASQ